MQTDFWLKRWQTHDTPWQQNQPEKFLTEYFPTPIPSRVMVPLCGKSVDLLWLKNQGSEVVGIELSAIACREFFDENKIEYKVRNQNDFVIYFAPGIEVWCGDFFKFPYQELSAFTFIYDRAALIAFPPDLRQKYSERIKEVAKSNQPQPLQILVVLREQAERGTDGPPFNISELELFEYFNDAFEIRKLGTQVDTTSDIRILQSAYEMLSKLI